MKKEQTLQQKIDAQRRKRKWERIRNRLRLKYYEYEEAGKIDKAVALTEKITKRVLKPCKRCGRF
jgi:hypothetical protein